MSASPDASTNAAGLPLAGVRVVEVASWTFVPSGGSVLVDWGAEVIKVEHPVTGDPQRGLITSGLVPGGAGGVNFMIEQPNRGKRSIGLNLAHPDGREMLLKLVETADVFLTNYMPPVRRKLRIDNDDLRERNPRIIIARGTGQGPLGPDAEKGGYDGASFWARGAMGVTLPSRPDGWPMMQPAPAFGDVMGGMATAGAIAAALYQRSATGEPSVVDVSLLATAMWQLSPLVISARLYNMEGFPVAHRSQAVNPGVNVYRTADDRFLSFILLQTDKHWPQFCECIGRPDLATDPRFVDMAARAENNEACIAILDEVFGAQPLAHWKEALADFKGVWTPFQTLNELYDDPQVIANGYLPTMTAANGQDVQLVANPAMFDEQPVAVERAPEHGEHTETLLLDAGVPWDDIAAMKESGAIL
ncbi:CaiB/BaiF CoA transferase family protein [Candidatus Poriferisocius sp.]|uniref:CaiB/BaiF CoA transferase family protein n=1 Tax=Candidatus Poriferisocius sp. TaxID=3101276 RepID=UPI003B59C620